MDYLEEEIPGKLFYRQDIGKDGVRLELVHRNLADDRLGWQDGAAHEHHIRLFFTKSIQASEIAELSSPAIDEYISFPFRYNYGTLSSTNLLVNSHP